MRIGTAFRTAFLVVVVLAACVFASRSLAKAASAAPAYLDQGLSWTAATREDFYSRDQGARISIFTEPLGATDTAFNVLTMSVGGSILQHYFPLLTLDVASAPRASTLAALTPLSRISETLRGAFAMPPSTTEFPYESRVLKGIWATAPYLHNGSVATLADLLKPAAERAPSFAVGPAYDIVNVGLAADQPKLKSTITTTDCSKRDSGNSRCGHEFGTTTLSVEEKRALLEYLKVL